jgi:hypothetical protein
MDGFEDVGRVVCDVGGVGAEDELGVAFDGAVLDARLGAPGRSMTLRSSFRRHLWFEHQLGFGFGRGRAHVGGGRCRPRRRVRGLRRRLGRLGL